LIAVSRVPLRFVAARLLTVLPFVIFALFLPFIGTGKDMAFAGIMISSEGVSAMFNVIAKAAIGATASILLAATTEAPDIIKGLTKLHVPAVITSIASFMIRYLEEIAGELGRMRTAMTSRGYDPRWLWQAKPIASSAGALFVRSYERGERVYDAMLSRGYNGTMPLIEERTASGSEWMTALSVPAVSILVSVLAAVTT
ncbi:MAG: cobalt ECF transporter T component CbiQ, partial [Acidimicrobiia bacterium]|nr:cobalt ECF transporter T component CbiQ [Acidimicrobiia bacterium]